MLFCLSMCDACYGGNPIEQVKSAKEWELRTFGRNAVTDEDYHEMYGTKIGPDMYADPNFKILKKD